MHSEHHVEIDQDSYATLSTIAAYRRDGLIAEPYTPERTSADDELDRDNIVNDRTLQKENRISGGGGSKNKGRKKAQKRLTGPERIAKHLALVKETAPDAYLNETDEQRARRQTLESQEAILRAEASKGGRPRKGAEVRERVSFRIEPAVRQVLRENGITEAEACERIADSLKDAA